MAYGEGMGYHLHMPSYFWRTFTEYPTLDFCYNSKKAEKDESFPASFLSLLSDSNQRPRDYKSRALAN